VEVEERIEASIEDVLAAVSQRFEVRIVDLRGKDRHKTIAFARHVAMYFCKRRIRYCPSFPEVGRAFGNRDHTTVMSAVQKIESMRERPDVRAHLEALERALRPDAPRLRFAVTAS
jgi:chromosomal replication initiator protein